MNQPEQTKPHTTTIGERHSRLSAWAHSQAGRLARLAKIAGRHRDRTTLIVGFVLAIVATIVAVVVAHTSGPALSNIAVTAIFAFSAALIGLVYFILKRFDELQSPFVLRYDTDSATEHLGTLYSGAVADVQNVWSLMHFGKKKFRELVDAQMSRLDDPASSHVLTRIINCGRIEQSEILSHVDDRAIDLIRRGKYVLWLVPSAGFGATVIDGTYGAVNFPSTRSVDRILYIACERSEPAFVAALQTLINSLYLDREDPTDSRALPPRRLDCSSMPPGDAATCRNSVHRQIGDYFNQLSGSIESPGSCEPGRP